MTPAESALLSLLRASLHGAAADFSADIDWDGVLAETNVQAVSALAAEGLPEDVNFTASAPSARTFSTTVTEF